MVEYITTVNGGMRGNIGDVNFAARGVNNTTTVNIISTGEGKEKFSRYVWNRSDVNYYHLHWFIYATRYEGGDQRGQGFWSVFGLYLDAIIAQ